MISWAELTDFGKGVMTGFLIWILLVVLFMVRGLYLNWNLGKMNPENFFIFNGSFGFTEMLLTGAFLVVALGVIGWLYGRIAGEIV